MTYLSYIVGIIIGPLTGKLINQIGNDSTIALGAVVFAFNIERPVTPPHSGIFDTPPFHVDYSAPLRGNSKPGPLESDFYRCFLIKHEKVTHKNYTIKRKVLTYDTNKRLEVAINR